MKWWQVVTVIPAIVDLIERLVNKPKAPTSAEKAKKDWEDAKRRIG